MDIKGKVVVVTGAGSGIGRALAVRFAAEGAAAVMVADLNEAGARETAQQINRTGGTAAAQRTDVSSQAEVEALVARATAEHGPIDLFCSNAGIPTGGGIDTPSNDWRRSWEVNLMAHVHAAGAVLPSMLERGAGYLLQTASAAGLLTNLGNAVYSVTKHAAVALAEWLAITYGDRGIKVSCLCPQGVRTPMLMGAVDRLGGAVVTAAGALLEPEDVAQAVVEGLAAERFLILPHPEVLDYWRNKASDYDRWLTGMRRLQARLSAELR